MRVFSRALLVGLTVVVTGLPATTSAVASAAPVQFSAANRLTDQQLRQRLTLVPKAAKTEHDLRARLGDAFGGLWIAGDPAVVQVGVTNQAAEDVARAAGAVPVRVRRSEAALNVIKTALDRKVAQAPRSAVGWFVDLPSNSVVVQALPSTAAAALDFARSAVADATAIRVVEVAEAPRLLADIRGGDAYYTGNVMCSMGFSIGQAGFDGGGYVTAGHCTNMLGAYANNGQFQRRSFPGDDRAFVRTNPGWISRPWVDTYNGGNATLAGSQEAPVGSAVCRSGATSGWHCGTILAKNQTVTYSDGSTVYGLTQTNACAEPGDSGGPFITGDQAQGVTSGGSGNCSGGSPITFFEPINPILSAWGLSLTVDYGQRYNIVAVHSGKCLDVSDASVADGALLHQWTCSAPGSANQKWRLVLVPGTTDTYNLIAWHSGKCADVTDASTADGALVHQWYCYPPGGTNQQWRLVPVPGMYNTYNLIAVHSGKCADVDQASMYDGALVHQWFCAPPGAANQQWQLIPVN